MGALFDWAFILAPAALLFIVAFAVAYTPTVAARVMAAIDRWAQRPVRRNTSRAQPVRRPPGRDING